MQAPSPPRHCLLRTHCLVPTCQFITSVSSLTDNHLQLKRKIIIFHNKLKLWNSVKQRKSSDKCSLLTWVCLLFVRVEVFRIGDGEHVVPGVRRRPSLCSRDGKHRLQPFKWEKVQSFVFWVLEEKQQKSLTGCIINFTIKCKSSTIFQETGTYESCLFLDLSSNPASSLNPAPATTPGQRQPLTPVCGAVLLSNLFRCNHCLRHPATNFLQLCILW